MLPALRGLSFDQQRYGGDLLVGKSVCECISHRVKQRNGLVLESPSDRGRSAWQGFLWYWWGQHQRQELLWRVDQLDAGHSSCLRHENTWQSYSGRLQSERSGREYEPDEVSGEIPRFQPDSSGGLSTGHREGAALMGNWWRRLRSISVIHLLGAKN